MPVVCLSFLCMGAQTLKCIKALEFNSPLSIALHEPGLFALLLASAYRFLLWPSPVGAAVLVSVPLLLVVAFLCSQALLPRLVFACLLHWIFQRLFSSRAPVLSRSSVLALPALPLCSLTLHVSACSGHPLVDSVVVLLVSLHLSIAVAPFLLLYSFSLLFLLFAHAASHCSSGNLSNSFASIRVLNTAFLRACR